MLTPPHKRPGRTETLMRQAQIVAERSTCTRSQVGVVIAHAGRVVSQGYNGAPAGMQHCGHTCTCGGRGPAPLCTPGCRFIKAEGWHDPNCAFERWTNRKHHSDQCASRTPCTISVHAEANAIAFAARYGVATNGADLYTTMWPCLACSQLIINAGITRVYMLNEYRDDSGVSLLKRAGVGVLPWSFPK